MKRTSSSTFKPAQTNFCIPRFHSRQLIGCTWPSLDRLVARRFSALHMDASKQRRKGQGHRVRPTHVLLLGLLLLGLVLLALLIFL